MTPLDSATILAELAYLLRRNSELAAERDTVRVAFEIVKAERDTLLAEVERADAQLKGSAEDFDRELTRARRAAKTAQQREAKWRRLVDKKARR